ncbi:MAG: hypothetical protein NT007_02210 [Candidatus Kapabacteria bacterium]|nr:hypothetical protein [Candidatus Kapabacteria bacterium]
MALEGDSCIRRNDIFVKYVAFETASIDDFRKNDSNKEFLHKLECRNDKELKFSHSFISMVTINDILH